MFLEKFGYSFASSYLALLFVWSRFCPAHSKISLLALLNIFSYGIILLFHDSGPVLVEIYVLLLVGYACQTEFVISILGRLPGILVPLVGLFAIQYIIPKFSGQVLMLDIFNIFPGEFLALGLSYICFRMLLFTFETSQNNRSLSAYLAYILFLPSCLVGPLTNSRVFLKSIQESNRKIRLDWSLIYRILWGFLKATLICGMFDRISYKGIIFDGNSHSSWALVLAAFGFYLYLYSNFSGICDIIISISAMCGIHLDENFDRPLLCSNLSQFWRSWHITLGRLFRNLIYAPLSLLGLRHSQCKNPFLWSSISSLVTFIAIGLWHGLAWKWVIFGLIHGVGIIVHSGYEQFKLWLIRNEICVGIFNLKVYHFSSWVLTQVYVAASLFFFANELSQIKSLSTILVW